MGDLIVEVDEEERFVMMVFPLPYRSLGFTPEQARAAAQALLICADVVEKRRAN